MTTGPQRNDLVLAATNGDFQTAIGLLWDIINESVGMEGGRVDTPRVRLGDGTLAAPAFTFENDPDTGIYRVSTNSFALVVGGVTIGMTIKADGSVIIPHLEQMEVVGSGLVDETATFQGALNASDTITVPPNKPMLIGEVDVLPGKTINWQGAKIIKKAGAKWCFRTTNTLGSPSSSSVHDVNFWGNAEIDMNGEVGIGLLLEAAWQAHVSNLRVIGIRPGYVNFDDQAGLGSNAYASAGITEKGIYGVSGCYYNRIERTRVQGLQATYGQAGYVRTSTTTSSTQRSNNSVWEQCRALWCEVGMFPHNGNDGYINMAEVSQCSIGIDVDDSDGIQINKPYAELCDTGIKIGTGAIDTKIIGKGSFAGTTVEIDDQGIRTDWDDRIKYGRRVYEVKVVPDNDPTPDVSNAREFSMNYTAPTDITDLDGGTNGQNVTFHMLGGNQTFKDTLNGGNFRLDGAVDFAPSGEASISFTLRSGIWRETARMVR